MVKYNQRAVQYRIFIVSISVSLAAAINMRQESAGRTVKLLLLFNSWRNGVIATAPTRTRTRICIRSSAAPAAVARGGGRVAP